MITRSALAVLALALIVSAQSYRHGDAVKDPQSEPKLVCYYSNWAVYRPGLAKFTPENINPYLCTHVIYAFASLSEEFELQPFDPYNDVEQGNYRSFVNLKSYNSGLKTMVAVGGWNEGSRRFSRLVESDENRRKFVSSAMVFLRDHGFDGLDLDWEYPAFREGGNQTTDKRGYALLVKELRQAIEDEKTLQSKEKLILSVAVPATKDYIDGGFDVPELSKYADFLNLLTYDYHSAYEPEAQHHAPLFPIPELDPKDEENRLNVAWTVNYYLSLGAPAGKLVVGVPLYGRSYTLSVPQLAHGYGAPADAPGEEGAATREKGYLSYYEICQRVKDDEWEVEAPSPDLMGPYAHKGNQWVGFDDEEMLLNKARYILDNNLGGAMIWTLDNDDFRGLCTGEPSPLVGTIRDVLLGSNLIAGSSSRRSVARSAAGPQERSSSSSDTVLRFDDEASAPEEVAEPPKRRNTLRKLVQNRQAARNRQAAGRRINTDADDNSVAVSPTTPAPPPTPDPGVVAFECTDEGFFNNPRDCRKYFWCLDSGPANLGVVAHAFTCPSGLHFNSGSESCDYPENVVCPVGSTGSSPAKVTPRPRPRLTTSTTTTTTTSTTTTEPPTTTTTEEPGHDDNATPHGGENVAELLRLLQAIGGVERLQSLLGAQEQASSDQGPVSRTLPQYVTPPRTTPEVLPTPSDSKRPSDSPAVPKRPQHDTSPYLDAYDYTRPDPTTEDDSDLEEIHDEEDEIEDPADFRFQYNTPSRGSRITPGVSYVRDDEEGISPQDGPSHETPEKPIAVSSTTAAPETSGGPYRTPIRVQVGRVVRVQNGTPANSAVDVGPGGRRRMLVRVRPAGNDRIVEDGPRPTADGPRVTGRTVGGDERKLSGSTLLAARAKPIGGVNGNGETRVAVRRRPVYPDRVPEEAERGIVQGGGVRLVARRPNALADGSNTDRGNFVTVRRRPTASQVPVQVTTTTTAATTTTTTTTTTTLSPEILQPRINATEEVAYDYDDEYYDDEYEDEVTTPSTTSTTTTTTSTRKPNARPPLPGRRRPIGETPKPATPAVVTTSSPRPTVSRRGSSPVATSVPTTTARPPPASRIQSDEDGPPVEVLSDSEIVCHRRGVFIHPKECSKFVLCAPVSRNAEQGLKGRVLNCPANQIYLVDIGRCMKGDRNQCQKL